MAKVKRRTGRGRPSNFSDKQVRRLLRSLGGLDPALRGHLNDKQIEKRSTGFVSAHLDPVRRETEATIERRSQRGTGAISGYTAEHEAQLAKIPGLVDADYTRQAQEEQALQEGLTGVLRGSGQRLQGELAARLQQAGIEPPSPSSGPPAIASSDTGGVNIEPMPIGRRSPVADDNGSINAFLATKAPPGATAGGPMPPEPVPPGAPGPAPGGRFSGTIGAFGQGAAGGMAASTYAGSSRIGSEGASQRAYAHELPGIAALGGRAATRDLQLQLNRELSDRMGEINAQAPGMAAEESERLRDRDLVKGQARGSYLNTYLDRELQRQVAAASTGLDYAKLASDEQLTRQAERGRNKRATQAERGRNQRASAHEEAQTQRSQMSQQGMNQRARKRLKAQGRQYDDAQSRSRGFLVDKKGRPILRSNGKRIPYKPPKSGSSNDYE